MCTFYEEWSEAGLNDNSAEASAEIGGDSHRDISIYRVLASLPDSRLGERQFKFKIQATAYTTERSGKAGDVTLSHWTACEHDVKLAGDFGEGDDG